MKIYLLVLHISVKGRGLIFGNTLKSFDVYAQKCGFEQMPELAVKRKKRE